MEFRKNSVGIPIHGHEGRYTVYPVEYKHGSPKDTDIDILQLAAQAICLEEMLVCTVPEGAIFYAQTRRRLKVQFTEELKNKVRTCFAEMHQLYARRFLPRPRQTKSCNACSLKEICMPRLARLQTASEYNRVQFGMEEDA